MIWGPPRIMIPAGLIVIAVFGTWEYLQKTYFPPKKKVQHSRIRVEMSINKELSEGFKLVSCPIKGNYTCYQKDTDKGPIRSIVTTYKDGKPESISYELNIPVDVEENITSEFVIR